MDATARLVAIIILTSFATERILAATNYFLDLADQNAIELRQRAKRKLFLVALGALVTGGVVLLAEIRILRLVTPDVSDVLDLLVTWLVVFAGADQVRTLLQPGGEAKPGAESAAPVKPPIITIQIDRDGNVHQVPAAK
jgi:hypothetical protein